MKIRQPIWAPSAPKNLEIMDRALITGGAGFIGSHLVHALVGAGFEVHVFDSFMNGRREHIADIPDEQVHVGDLRDAERLAAVVARLRHAASIIWPPFTSFRTATITPPKRCSSTFLVQKISSTRLPATPQNLFFASTAAVYPPKAAAHVESDVASPTDIYGATKLAGEALVESLSAASGAPCIIGRLFNAVGHRETNPHLVPEIVRQLAGGARSIRLGNLEPMRDFIDARDMAKGIVAASGCARREADYFNIGAGRQYSVVEVVRICERIGEPIEIVQDPARIRKVERPSLLAGTEKLMRATGWRPQIALDQTLAELLQGR